MNTDGTIGVSYTASCGKNGICSPAAGDQATSTGSAKIPFFNAECPGDISVHANDGGPVYLNGKEAEFASFSKTYLEAKEGDVTISVTNMPDGKLDISFTGPGRAAAYASSSSIRTKVAGLNRQGQWRLWRKDHQ